MYLPKGYSRSPYKYNKIIKNSIFLLSLDSADLSGAHTHKIQVLPFLTAPSPLTGLGKNLSSQFKLPVVMQTVGCSGSVPGLGNTSQQANTATQKRSWFRGKQNTRDRKSLDQVCTHTACRPAEPHLQLGTIFKEAPSLIKNPTLRVKRRKGLLSCFFSSLCLKKKKLYFSMESSRTWSGANERSATHSGESDLLPTSPRAGAIPNKARGAAAQGLIKIGQDWAQPGVHPLFAQSGTSGAEGGHQCGMRRKEDPPPARSGTGWLPVEAKAGSARLQGHRLLSDQWAGKTSPGVAPAAVRPSAVTPAPASS